MWRILGALGGLILAAVVAAIVVILSTDPNDYRRELGALVSAQTGYHVDFEGELAWSLMPLGVEVENVAVAAAAGREPFARIARTGFAARLWPLLSPAPVLEVEAVTFEGLALDLRVDADGEANWVPPLQLARATPWSGSGGAAAGDTPTATGSAAAVDLSVDRVEIRDGTLRYVDALALLDARIDGLQVRMSDIAPGTPFPITLEARLHTPDQPDTALAGRANVQIAADFNEITVIDLVLDATPQQTPPLQLTGAIDLTLAPLQATTRDFRVQTSRLGLGADVRYAATETGYTIEGRMHIDSNDLEAVMADYGAPIPLGGEQDFRTLTLDSPIRGDESRLELSAVELKLDDQSLRGNAAVEFTESTTRLLADLSGARFDVDRYLAVPESQAGGGGGPSATDAARAALDPAVMAAARAPLIPLESLAGIEWQLKMKLDTLLLSGIEFGAVEFATTLGTGILTADVSGRAWQGTLRPSIQIDLGEVPPAWRIRMRGNGIDHAGWMAWTGISLPLTGTANLQADLTARGNSMVAVHDSLRGKLTLESPSGTFATTGFKQGILQVANLLDTNNAVNRWPDVVDYTLLRADLDLGNGLLAQKLDFRLENLSVTGGGATDLISDLLDYRLEARVGNDPKYQAFDLNSSLVDVPVPLRCQGALSTTPCGVDADAAGKVVARILARKGSAELEKVIDEQVPEELRDAAKGLLRGLFGN